MFVYHPFDWDLIWCGTHDLQEPKMTAQSIPEGQQFVIVESKFGGNSFDNNIIVVI